jgi:hypothetical protein
VFIVAEGKYYGNILLTFSFSIALIYLLQEWKAHLFERRTAYAVVWGTAFVAATGAVFVFTQTWGVDYGFAGVMTTVAVALFDDRKGNAPVCVPGDCV